MDDLIKQYKDFIGQADEKYYKDTLFHSDHMLVGINCLEPGQKQTTHAHDDADKMYLVLKGIGRFVLGEGKRDAGKGEVVFAPAGVPHGVENPVRERLVLLVCIAPPPPPKD